MAIEFEVSGVIGAAPDRVYEAWLSAEEHSKMTGSPATGADQIGTTFHAWDGYITGKTLELEPPMRILQQWRTSEFAPYDPDSRLEIFFAAHPEGTLVRLVHSNLPEHGMQYHQGWIDSYFNPMNDYFRE